MTLTQAQTERDGALVVTLAGALTEAAELDGLAATIEAHAGAVELDLSGLRRINSMGVKVWVSFVDRLARGPRPGRIVLAGCSVAFVNQLNMVRGVRGPLGVASVQVPFLCPACETAVERAVDVTHAPRIEPPSCPACAAPTELDAVETQYFAFLSA